ncbi:MAG: hypothetical protein DRK00_09015 [Thermoprotei archaeon]|nr:MAG: hypothetical protein DRK00_09015 [Thermoprotei archaeon]
MSKDLESSRFFEGFTVIVPAVVRKECDVRRGKQELSKLAKFASMGRIKIESSGRVEEVPGGLPSNVRDEMIVDSALQYNAILITADKAVKALAASKNIFIISL